MNILERTRATALRLAEENEVLRSELRSQTELNKDLMDGMSQIFALGHSPMTEPETITATRMWAIARSIINKHKDINPQV